MVANPENTWIGLEYFCKEGDELWNKTETEMADFAVQELISIELVKKEDILESTVIKMKKTYPAYTGSYLQFEEVKNYLNLIPNFIPIGRNGMHKYNNSDHSMLTAMEAVDMLLDNCLQKEKLWLINTEEAYHEEAAK